jgi:hypothetical protein
LDIVAIFWLPAVELNSFAMYDHLAVLTVVVSHDIQRARGSLFQVSIVTLKSSFQSHLAALD